MANYIQNQGIKFPFTIENGDGHFLDLNIDTMNKVASQITHVILTPKKTKLRDPEFGTNLMQYIFEISDNITWSNIIDECKHAVSTYVPNVELNELRVIETEDDNALYLNIEYTVSDGKNEENNRLVLKI